MSNWVRDFWNSIALADQFTTYNFLSYIDLKYVRKRLQLVDTRKRIRQLVIDIELTRKQD